MSMCILYILLWLVLAGLAIASSVRLWRRRPVRGRLRFVWRIVRPVALVVVVTVLFLLALMFINATFFGSGAAPKSGRTSHPPAWPMPDSNGITLRVMAYNIWMGGAHWDTLRLEGRERTAERIRLMGELIRKQQPDLVFLQEVLMEFGPNSPDQTALLARTAGMHAWVFGKTINLGFPACRLIRGNAILSRRPLEAVTNQQLDRQNSLHWIGLDNQRALWCRTRIGSQEVLLASIHLTAFRDMLRPTQMQQILDLAAGRPAILAGDFNAEPSSSEIDLILAAERFSAEIEGPSTFRSDDPARKIDYIFAPKDWVRVEHRVIPCGLSDHLPVLSVYRVVPVVDSAH
jgi:endonuclease/exonuclease/phosphatase family metal-dependent hydrolase